MVRSIALNTARTICGSNPDNVRSPLGGESTWTVVNLPNCAMIDDAARTTGCGCGGGGVTAGMLGRNVGSGPDGVAEATGEGVSCGDALELAGALSSGCATARDCVVTTAARWLTVPSAAAPMTLAAATMQHVTSRRPSTYAIA